MYDEILISLSYINVEIRTACDDLYVVAKSERTERDNLCYTEIYILSNVFACRDSTRAGNASYLCSREKTLIETTNH